VMIDWDKAMAIAILAAAAALGIVLVLVVLGLARSALRWVAAQGKPKARRAEAKMVPIRAGSIDSPVSASDLYAVRANLDAVSRQLADLEMKLRLTSVPHTTSPK
jgi:hypothetical protein